MNEQLLLKLEFLSMIRLAKEKYTLKELSEILGVDIPTLSKYVNEHLYPSIKKINQMLPILRKIVNPWEELNKLLLKNVFDFPELNNVLSACPHILNIAAIYMTRRLRSIEFDTILSVEGGGMVLATLLAFYLNKKLVFGVRDAYMPGGLSLPYTTVKMYIQGPRIKRYITIPKKSLKKGEDVVIVDDISWTGGTIYTLYKLATRLRANVRYIYVLAIFEHTYRKLSKKIDTKVDYLLLLPNNILKRTLI